MKTNRFFILACVSLAMSFTFSCSSGDDDPPNPGGDGISSSSGGGGGSCTNPSSYDTPNPVEIGGQVWMKENLNYAACGSKCYGEGGVVAVLNFETESTDYITLPSSEIQANCARYGRLYNWATAMALPSKCNRVLSTSDPDCAINTPHHRGICPSGWHIPSNDEWDALYRHADPEYRHADPDYDVEDSEYVSHRAGRPTVGEKLAATSGWNEGVGTDDFGFAALPGGLGFYPGYVYHSGRGGTGWWSTSADDGSTAYVWSVGIVWGNDNAWYYVYLSADRMNDRSKNELYSVRCVQDKESSDGNSSSSGGGLSSSSGGGGGDPSFGTCSEAEAAISKCSAELKTNAEFIAAFMACMSSGKTEDECIEMMKPMVFPCVQNSGVCVDVSFEECKKRLEECGL